MIIFIAAAYHATPHALNGFPLESRHIWPCRLSVTATSTFTLMRELLARDLRLYDTREGSLPFVPADYLDSR